MKTKKIHLTIVLLTILGFVLCAEVKDCDHLRFIKIAKPESVKSNADIIAINIDSEVFNQTDNLYAGIRLADELGKMVPFAIKILMAEKTVVSQKECYSKVISLKRHPNNSVEIILKKNEDGLIPDALNIQTPNRNFEKQLVVWGSNDQKSWQVLNKDAEIFDYSKIIGLSKTSVTLEKQNFKYYKVVISNFSEEKASPYKNFLKETRQGKEFSLVEKTAQRKEELKLDRIILLASVEEKKVSRNATKEYQTKTIKVLKKEHKTNILVETYKQPLTSFHIETDSCNFSRTVKVCSSNDLKKWQVIADDKSFYAIKVKGYYKECKNINFPETRSKYYKIIIKNKDAAPIDSPKIKAFGNIYRCETLWSASLKTVLLFYGGKLSCPNYDVQEIMDKIKNPVFSVYKLETQEDNPNYNPELKKEEKPVNYKILFIIFIGIMVVVLGWILAKNIGKIDEVKD
jgi:hypothetical protein